MTEPFPLLWPENEPRTPSHDRRDAAFKVMFVQARDGLIREIERMGGHDVVITSNLVPRKNDGLPRAGQGEPTDPGVAVYFWYQGELHSMACDQWAKVKDNLRALEKSIEAIRGLDRWGATGIKEKTIKAFAYLPPAGKISKTESSWWETLGVQPDAPFSVVQAAWRALVKEGHPDRGGNPERFRKINQAYAEAQQVKGVSV